MSEQRQPKASAPANDKREEPGEGGAPLGNTTATPKSGTREETIAELKAEFKSFQPSEFPRDLDENDEEWRRAGGGPEK